MASLFALQGRLVSKAPVVAIGVTLALTGLFGIGFFLEAGPVQDQAESFLPPGSELAQAQARINEDFASIATTIGVQVIFRGEAHTSGGMADMQVAFQALLADDRIAPWLAEPAATHAADLLARALNGTDPSTLNDADLDAAVADARADPNRSGLLSAAEAMLAGDLDRAVGAIGLLHLDAAAGPAGSDRQDLDRIQLVVEEILQGSNLAVLDARSFSGPKLAQESAEAQGASTNILMAIALGVILLVLVLFFRNIGDVATTVLGLVLAIVWVFGIQGLLGPGGVGWIGADNPLAMMIPVLLIGLTVDYALQIVTRYREELRGGAASKSAIGAAVHQSGLPLFLAAGTTTISFLTNLTSSLPPLQDFGVVAGIGVMSGWFIMGVFLPAVRVLIDGRREARGKPLQDRSMVDAIPGIGKVLGGLSRVVVRHPTLILVAVGGISLASFFGAANVSTTFSQSDFLPESTDSFQDLAFLDEHFGGGSATATLLIEGDLTDDEVLRDVVDLEIALFGEATRPRGMTGPTQASFFSLAFDWSADSGLPGDRFDPSVAPLLDALDRFYPESEDVRALYSKIQALDPDGFGRVVALHPTGVDRTIIIVPLTSGDAQATDHFLHDVRGLWQGDPDAFFVTGADILTNAVTQEMTDSQASSVFLTIAAALIVLMVFFGVTERHAALGIVAVLPIGLVVGWILGSMFLLGISYNVMTALITALTIGVGVDYTIHVTHRFLEELEKQEGILHAVHESMRTTGGALLGSALTTALGFGVLVFSPLAPMQQFGGLTALTILYSLIASFLVLPPMLVLWATYREWKERQFVQERLAPKGLAVDPKGVVTVTPLQGGRSLTCPQCATPSFVPDHARRIRCSVCGKEGTNARAAVDGSA